MKDLHIYSLTLSLSLSLFPSLSLTLSFISCMFYCVVSQKMLKNLSFFLVINLSFLNPRRSNYTKNFSRSLDRNWETSCEGLSFRVGQFPWFFPPLKLCHAGHALFKLAGCCTDSVMQSTFIFFRKWIGDRNPESGVKGIRDLFFFSAKDFLTGSNFVVCFHL